MTKNKISIYIPIFFIKAILYFPYVLKIHNSKTKEDRIKIFLIIKILFVSYPNILKFLEK